MTMGTFHEKLHERIEANAQKMPPSASDAESVKLLKVMVWIGWLNFMALLVILAVLIELEVVGG